MQKLYVVRSNQFLTKCPLKFKKSKLLAQEFGISPDSFLFCQFPNLFKPQINLKN